MPISSVVSGSSSWLILFKKSNQICQCLCKNFFFLWIHILNRCLDHFFMELTMVFICPLSFFSKRYQYYSSVFFTACAVDIPFFYKVVDRIVSVPTVTKSVFAIADIFRGSLIPIASMICISLFDISQNSPVRIAFSSSVIIS